MKSHLTDHAMRRLPLQLTARGALEKKGYAELANQQAGEEPNKHATARRNRPTWTSEE